MHRGGVVSDAFLRPNPYFCRVDFGFKASKAYLQTVS
jgi:hypothetical protein